ENEKQPKLGEIRLRIKKPPIKPRKWVKKSLTPHHLYLPTHKKSTLSVEPLFMVDPLILRLGWPNKISQILYFSITAKMFDFRFRIRSPKAEFSRRETEQTTV
ncbi:MAG TPA: hypothetical protein VFK27_02925, partial [Bacillales bacterium]|nr:hypothetical protein [Bacillales bacterium]